MRLLSATFLDNAASDDKEDPMVFYDPTGARYGRPTYPFKMAPEGPNAATAKALVAQLPK